MKESKKLNIDKINAPIFLKIVDSDNHLAIIKISEIRSVYTFTESRWLEKLVIVTNDGTKYNFDASMAEKVIEAIEMIYPIIEVKPSAGKFLGV